MPTSTLLRWLVVAVSAAMLLAFAAACTETVEVPGETIVVEKEVIKEVQVPGETVVVEKEVIKTVEVPGETVVKEVIKEVMVPGETVVVTKEIPVQVTRTVEVPGPERVMVKEVPGKKYVTDPVTGRVYSAPEYGGMITFAKSNDYSNRGVDLPNYGNRGMTSPMIEKLSAANWALDRSLYPWAGGGRTPVFALTGGLAESWEWDRRPDPRVQDAPGRQLAQQGADERAGPDRRRCRIRLSSDAWEQAGSDRVQR